MHQINELGWFTNPKKDPNPLLPEAATALLQHLAKDVKVTGKKNYKPCFYFQVV